MRVRLIALGGSLLFAISQIVFPGCATLTGGVAKPVQIDSEPPHARVFVNDRLRGTTPLTTSVSRWGIHRVRLEAPGCQPREFRLEKCYNQAVGGNLLIGIAPVAIDLVSGAVFDLRIPEEARKSEGHEIVRIHPGAIFNQTLSFTVDLRPQSDPRKRAQSDRR